MWLEQSWTCVCFVHSVPGWLQLRAEILKLFCEPLSCQSKQELVSVELWLPPEQVWWVNLDLALVTLICHQRPSWYLSVTAFGLVLGFASSIVVVFACFVQQHSAGRLVGMQVVSQH